MNANFFLSLFLSLAMLMSGASYAADPAAASASSVSISDISITVDGEEYALNPVLNLGIQTEGNSVLLDGSVRSGETTLFPIQAKMDESGLSLMLSKDGSAYVLPAELLNEEIGDLGIPKEAFEAWIAAFSSLVTEAAKLQELTYDAEYYARMGEQLYAILPDIVEEETTITRSGAEEPATRSTYSINQEQWISMMDAMLSDERFSGYMAAYAAYMEATLALTGTETSSDDLTLSSLFKQLVEETGLEMSFDVVEVTNAEGFGTADILMHISVPITDYESVIVDDEETWQEVEKTISLELPMNMVIHDADTIEVSLSDTFVVEGEQLTVDCKSTVDGKNQSVSVLLVAGNLLLDVEAAAVFDIAYASVTNEDGSTSFNLNYDIAVEGETVALDLQTVTADGVTAADFAVDALGMYGFSCHLETSSEPIEDRIAAAPKAVFTSLDDDEDPAMLGLGLSALGLAGDLEVLMSDESVAKLVELFASNLAVFDTASTMVTEESVPIIEENTTLENADLDAASIGVIGGADGPTSVFVAANGAEAFSLWNP